MEHEELQPQMKRCTKCGEIKKVSEFNKDKRAKDGFLGYCRTCSVEKSRKYRENNREKVKLQSRIQYRKDIDKSRNQNKVLSNKYYNENPIKAREKSKKYRLAHPEKLKKYHKNYRENNLEKVKNATLKWKCDNKEYIKEYQRELEKRRRDNLLNAYVKRILSSSGLNYELLNAYPELIENKRMQIKFKRLLKQRQDEIKKTS